MGGLAGHVACQRASPPPRWAPPASSVCLPPPSPALPPSVFLRVRFGSGEEVADIRADSDGPGGAGAGASGTAQEPPQPCSQRVRAQTAESRPQGSALHPARQPTCGGTCRLQGQERGAEGGAAEGPAFGWATVSHMRERSRGRTDAPQTPGAGGAGEGTGTHPRVTGSGHRRGGGPALPAPLTTQNAGVLLVEPRALRGGRSLAHCPPRGGTRPWEGSTTPNSADQGTLAVRRQGGRCPRLSSALWALTSRGDPA